MGTRREKQFKFPSPGRARLFTELTQIEFGGLSAIEEVGEALKPINQFGNAIPRDAFDDIFNVRLQKDQVRKDPSVIGDRDQRYRGVTLKEETVASLRIISNLVGEKRNILEPRKTTAGFEVFATDQFVLQAVTETDNEKIQVVETFGEPIIFLFGRRPRFYNFSGFLFNGGDSSTNAEDNSGYSTLWRDNFKLAYELFIRGTRCVKFRARAYLTYDRVMREGFIISSTISQDIRPNMVQFSFTMYITREINLDGRLAISANTNGGFQKPYSPEEAAPGALKQAIDPRSKDRKG